MYMVIHTRGDTLKEMTKQRIKQVKAEVAQKKDVSRVVLPRELRGLVIDTSRLKNKKTSTQILKELRYQVQ